MSRRQWMVSGAAFVVLIYAALHVDWQRAAAIIGKTSPLPLAAAVLLNALSVALRGVRWWIFLRQVGAASLGLAIRGALVGAGLNNVLLANAGDAARALLVARAANARRAAALATLALDRLFDPICFALLLVLATFTIRLPAQLTHAREATVAGLIVVGVALIALRRRSRPNDAGNRWRDYVTALSTPRRLAAAFAISLAVWTMQLATFALVARATGIALPLAGSVAAMLLADTGLLLRATPGNVGFFQFAYRVASRHYGVPDDAAIATALLLQIVQALPITLVGLAFIPGLVRSRPFLDSKAGLSYRRDTPALHATVTAL